MPPSPCFECSKPSETEHHVVPRIYGGTNTISLCYECHAKVHNIKKMATSAMIKAGMKAAREKGIRVGRPLAPIDPAQLIFLKLIMGLTFRELEKLFKIPFTTLTCIYYRHINNKS